MDGFTDTLSQRFASSQEMINANAQAEAEEMQNLQQQVSRYEGVLERINETVDTLEKKIGEIQAADTTEQKDAAEEYTAKLTGVEGKLQEHIHKENVRVYRNVQASVADELSKQTKALVQNIERLEERLTGIETGLAGLEARIEEQNKSNTSVLETMEKHIVKGKARLSLQIIIMLLVCADIAFAVLRFLGIL